MCHRRLSPRHPAPHRAAGARAAAARQFGGRAVVSRTIYGERSEQMYGPLQKLCEVLVVCLIFVLSPSPHALIVQTLEYCYNCIGDASNQEGSLCDTSQHFLIF